MTKEEEVQLDAVDQKPNGISKNQADCCILAHEGELPSHWSPCKRFMNQFKCPPHGYFEYFIRMLLTVFLVWATPWSIVGDYMLPGTNGFGIILIFICSLGLGIAVTKIPMPFKLPPLPSLMGNLLMGLLLRNLPPPYDFVRHIDGDWSANIRKIALTVILIRAGVGLDADALKRMKGVCFRLAFLPCLVEASVDAVCAYLILGFPIQWGFMLGFTIAAISPAVVVPSMVSLGDRGYGKQAGIPSLMIASASIDDILAISMFHVILGLTDMKAELNPMDHGNATALPTNVTQLESLEVIHYEKEEHFSHNLAWEIARGPVELIVGLAAGILIGIALWYIPNKMKRSSRSGGRLESGIIRDRTFLVFSLSLLCMFGSKRFEIVGSGPVACLIMGFVASIGWGKKSTEPVKVAMARIWFYGQPLLFGLIGAEVYFEAIEGNFIGGGMAVLAIGLVFRTIAAFLATLTNGLTVKEAMFIGFGWLPKATVQAAIGGNALDHARQLNGSEDSIRMGKQILTIAALSIVVTAPIGAVIIGVLGPRWLKRDRRGSCISRVDFEAQDSQ